MRFSYKPFFIIPIFFLVSCEKFVDINPPSTQIYSEALFNDKDAIVSAVTGLYSQMSSQSNTIPTGGLSLYGSLSADELVNTISNAELDVFTQNSLSPANESVIYGKLWKPSYSLIYHANKVLEGIELSHISSSLKNQLSGEALVIRALNYFYLTNLFGDVPLILSTDFEKNSIQPRIPPTSIYDQIIEDLEKSINLLGNEYPSSGRVRVNKYAAHALLARVCLYAGRPEKALIHADSVIKNGGYEMENDPNNAFLSSSTEAIWQLMPVNLYQDTPEGYVFVPYSKQTIPGYTFRPSFIASFEDNDLRFDSWIGVNTINGFNYYFPYKFKNRVGGPPYGEYTLILRFAEQFLIRAEAYALTGNLDLAVKDINTIRRRALLPEVNVTNQDEAISTIMQERKSELFAEWGHRWLDLKRLGLAGSALKDLKAPNWDATDVLYPIPFTELQTNPFLNQNAGY
ncbi:RagB/SusD family nutrient uptake outer membrane protein [Agriterribacter sp.]|uniref:RagB/SusD family nutrient uptake outer membrane protein n=1 Tax=Agriterribacter sp. TaxID=2821509 RepID=UPI002B968A76|nr:RagB/SusD family nutrient uptake outer membrane protein [Agriterribacter sp.]HRP56437.1 RagB/SusD family nutrient uptake outer membrane protein [Agriterribacter sp.]